VREERAIFRKVDLAYGSEFRKLRNVVEYHRAGLPTVEFWIVRDESIVANLVAGDTPEDVEREAALLSRTPIVMRTDIAGAAVEDTQMLPRSDSLLGGAAVLNAMRDAARRMLDRGIEAHRVGFIFHRYLPAMSAAFCYAAPDERKVRLEAVWGLADGLSYFSHDTFEVDCGELTLGDDVKALQRKFRLREKIRYKSQCLIEEADGRWAAQMLAAPWDWRRAIPYTKWIYDIAYLTKRFSTYQGRRVNMMWFVGVDRAVSPVRLLPWYHEEADVLRAVAKAPGAARVVGQHPVIRSRDDIELLAGQNVSSIRLEPDPMLVRDREFAIAVAQFSRERRVRIELAGGLLSHTFYMLKQGGALVECVDPFESAEETESFGKLVRDRVPERIVEKGESVTEETLHGEELIHALKAKLIEEALEAADALGRSALIEEIADIQEVMRTLCNRLGIEAREIDEVRERKRVERGGFEYGRVLVETRNPPLARSDDEPMLFPFEARSNRGRILLQQAAEGRGEHQASRIQVSVPIVPGVGSDGTHRTALIATTGLLGVSVERIGKNMIVEIEELRQTEQLALF